MYQSFGWSFGRRLAFISCFDLLFQRPWSYSLPEPGFLGCSSHCTSALSASAHVLPSLMMKTIKKKIAIGLTLTKCACFLTQTTLLISQTQEKDKLFPLHLLNSFIYFSEEEVLWIVLSPSQMFEITGVVRGTSKTGTQYFTFLVQNCTKALFSSSYPKKHDSGPTNSYYVLNLHIPSSLDTQLKKCFDWLKMSVTAFRLILLTWKLLRCWENNFVARDNHSEAQGPKKPALHLKWPLQKFISVQQVLEYLLFVQ